VWLQIPRLYPHRPPVVNRIAYSQSSSDQDHIHHYYHSAPELGMPHHDVPTKDWFPAGDTLLVNEQQHQHHSRIHSLVFTTDEYMLTRTPTTGPTVYALWSPIQRLGDALDCIIQHLMAVNVNISLHSSSSPNSVEQHEHAKTTTRTNTAFSNDHHDDASVARLSRFWHEKETASCSPPEADRATEKQRPRSDTTVTTNTSAASSLTPILHDSNTNRDMLGGGGGLLALPEQKDDFPPNRFDQGYERDSPWSAMDVSN
jgi:hypothetical protein